MAWMCKISIRTGGERLTKKSREVIRTSGDFGTRVTELEMTPSDMQLKREWKEILNVWFSGRRRSGKG